METSVQKKKVNERSLENKENLKKYLVNLSEAMLKGASYPVAFEDVWGLGYTTKGNAVRELKTRFEEGSDYKVVIKKEEGAHGRPSENYQLTMACFEWLIARNVRSVFEVYRQVFHTVVEANINPGMNQVYRARVPRTPADEDYILDQKYFYVMTRNNTFSEFVKYLEEVRIRESQGIYHCVDLYEVYQVVSTSYKDVLEREFMEEVDGYRKFRESAEYRIITPKGDTHPHYMITPEAAYNLCLENANFAAAFVTVFGKHRATFWRDEWFSPWLYFDAGQTLLISKDVSVVDKQCIIERYKRDSSDKKEKTMTHRSYDYRSACKSLKNGKAEILHTGYKSYADTVHSGFVRDVLKVNPEDMKPKGSVVGDVQFVRYAEREADKSRESALDAQVAMADAEAMDAEKAMGSTNTAPVADLSKDGESAPAMEVTVKGTPEQLCVLLRMLNEQMSVRPLLEITE